MYAHPLRPSRLALSLCVLLATALTACDTEDTDDVDGTPITDVLAAVTVDGEEADFVNASFPEEGSGEAPTVSGGDEIVRGGSLLLTVEAPEGADALLLGLSGDYGGHFHADITSRIITVVVTSEADADLGSFTLLIATEEDGEVSEIVRHTVTVNTQAGTSDQLQVSLNWNAPVDLDLHLETPDGVDIYWGNTSDATGGELDLDSNAGCELDRVDNENITWGDDETPPSGEYVVRVDLWSACGHDDPIPFVVTVNRHGDVDTFTGTFDPDDADQGGAFDGREITTFSF
ncbi:MAG TPA: hypothetical protein VK002_08380 [Rubricoccaceae bacterium]|nr:hypothetical protein [Rubricoccaceae bacterium]